MGGGLVMLWKEHLEVSLHSFSSGHIDIWVDNWLPSGGCFLTGFYGHWNVSLRKQSWLLLRRIGSSRTHAWCIIGDFNEVLSTSETTSRLGRPAHQMNLFRDTVADLHLHEIGLDRCNFTWWNKRRGEASVRSKLDRCFCNANFAPSRCNLKVSCFPAPSSDHHAIVLIVQSPEWLERSTQKNIHRLELWWLDHADTTNIIHNHWRHAACVSPMDFRRSLCELQSQLWQWSHKKFEKAQREIQRLRTQLMAMEGEQAPDD